MASLSTNEKNGFKTIQFKARDGKRRSIRLGKMTAKLANAFKLRVEYLISSQLTGNPPDSETSQWLTSLDDSHYEKLVSVGLVPQREKQNQLLGQFLDDYINGRDDVKKSTIEHLTRSALNLKEFFGHLLPLTAITSADAEDFQRYLVRSGLSENTVRRRCGRAKQFFNYAKKKRLITENPFDDLKTNVGANREKMYFLKREDADKIVEACPDNEWRLLFVLARYGGLRCPSESLSLQWSHINWEKEKIVVPSPKTEHHEGGASRIIPLFPEIRPYLEIAFDQAEPGTKYVITRYRSKNSNLRTQFLRIIRQAGLEAWVKPFQNLRSTRETELMNDYPIQVVCEWIGNSQLVAQKHYLQVTDEHFKKAVQKAVQHTAEMAGNSSQEVNTAHEKSPDLQGLASSCCSLQVYKAPPVGLEPTTKRLTAARSTN